MADVPTPPKKSAVDFAPFTADPEPAQARRLAEGFSTMGALSILLVLLAIVFSLGWPAWVFMHFKTSVAWPVFVLSVIALVVAFVRARAWEKRRRWREAARFVLFARANGFAAHPPVRVDAVEGLPEAVADRRGSVIYRLSGTYLGRAFQIGQIDEEDQMPTVFLEVTADHYLPSGSVYTPLLVQTAKAAGMRFQTTGSTVVALSSRGRPFHDADMWRTMFALVEAINDALDHPL